MFLSASLRSQMRGEGFTLCSQVQFKSQRPLRRAMAAGAADGSGRAWSLRATEGNSAGMVLSLPDAALTQTHHLSAETCHKSALLGPRA